MALASSMQASAQHAYFLTRGIIKFEKETYMKARIRAMQGDMSRNNPGMMMGFGGRIDDIPEKSSSFFSLQFDEDETLMTPEDSEDSTSAGERMQGRARPMGNISIGGGGSRGGGRAGGGNAGAMRSGNAGRSRAAGGATTRMRVGRGLGGDKIYYQNFASGESEVALEIDEKYLLKDSLQNITWRFTDEYRDIAGYTCRRVNGATPDSLYLVAFYTEEIPISGGPALVHGLPGMILGLAIPEMHINYWATSVEIIIEKIEEEWRDKKSNAMRMSEFFKSLAGNARFGGSRDANSAQYRRNMLENLIY